MKINSIIIDENKGVFGYIIRASLIIFFIFMISFVPFIIGIFTNTADVTKKEFGAQAALKKYEWFKDAHHELNRKLIDIDLYEKRVERCYAKKEKNCEIIEEQLFAIKSSYNGLVSQYNSASDKFNWELFNAEKYEIPHYYKKK